MLASIPGVLNEFARDRVLCYTLPYALDYP
jgi:hypothetical protein